MPTVARARRVQELGAASNPTRRMPNEAHPSEKPSARFRTTLVRVLVVQAVALTLLGILQHVYNR